MHVCVHTYERILDWIFVHICIQTLHKGLFAQNIKIKINSKSRNKHEYLFHNPHETKKD